MRSHKRHAAHLHFFSFSQTTCGTPPLLFFFLTNDMRHTSIVFLSHKRTFQLLSSLSLSSFVSLSSLSSLTGPEVRSNALFMNRAIDRDMDTHSHVPKQVGTRCLWTEQSTEIWTQVDSAIDRDMDRHSQVRTLCKWTVHRQRQMDSSSSSSSFSFYFFSWSRSFCSAACHRSQL